MENRRIGDVVTSVPCKTTNCAAKLAALVTVGLLPSVAWSQNSSISKFDVVRDVGYAEPKNARQSLDVYFSASLQNAPTIIWIHGGGWRRGDKGGMETKAATFFEQGYVFVSTTYRFFPEVSIKEMTGDVAKSIRWVRDNIRRYGGDPQRLIVMGHSAGAHLAALVCTDDRYLRAEGVPLACVKGCVTLDGGAYDIPHRVQAGVNVREVYKEVFGGREETYRDYSPALHVAEGKSIPPFLIFYVAGREETKTQSLRFAEQLKAVEVEAEVVAAQNKTHATLESELGLDGDKPTAAVLEFLKTSLGSK
ncbi:MAG: alpha/beta hydrolase [Planctomycetaceae bacterium]|nr:alpha/beta hydrolase [Planctomycetaceae bacterium]